MNKENIDNILFNMQHMDEFEENLIETAEERIKNITKDLKKDNEYKKFVNKLEEDGQRQRSFRDRLVPQMRSFIQTSDLDVDSL